MLESFSKLTLLHTNFSLCLQVIISHSAGDFGDCDFDEKFEDEQCKPCPKCPVGFGLPSVSFLFLEYKANQYFVVIVSFFWPSAA